MNVVLYTMDLEPITVIDLPLWAMEQGESQGAVRLAVPQPLPVTPYTCTDIRSMRVHAVLLRFHRLRFYGRDGWMVTVDDEALALKLRASWLPGQQREINDQRKLVQSLTDTLLRELQWGRNGK